MKRTITVIYRFYNNSSEFDQAFAQLKDAVNEYPSTEGAVCNPAPTSIPINFSSNTDNIANPYLMFIFMVEPPDHYISYMAKQIEKSGGYTQDISAEIMAHATTHAMEVIYQLMREPVIFAPREVDTPDRPSADIFKELFEEEEAKNTWTLKDILNS